MPGVKKGCKSKGKARRWRASWCNKKAGALLEVVEPFLAQATAGVLSEVMAMDGCGSGLWAAGKRHPVIRAVNSKSLFVRVPVGLSCVMSWSRMGIGKVVRHSIF